MIMFSHWKWVWLIARCSGTSQTYEAIRVHSVTYQVHVHNCGWCVHTVVVQVSGEKNNACIDIGPDISPFVKGLA